jgi:hypothetical protein
MAVSWMNDELKRDLKEAVILSRHITVGPDKNYEKPHSGLTMF